MNTPISAPPIPHPNTSTPTTRALTQTTRSRDLPGGVGGQCGHDKDPSDDERDANDRALHVDDAPQGIIPQSNSLFAIGAATLSMNSARN